MPYDPTLDKALKTWKCEQTGLVVSINRYGEGEPKVQIGPRLYMKKDGSESQRKAGRLSIEDFLWLYDVLDEIKEELQQMALPE